MKGYIILVDVRSRRFSLLPCDPMEDFIDELLDDRREIGVGYFEAPKWSEAISFLEDFKIQVAKNNSFEQWDEKSE